jgi:YegS/Rv2252/BmrU family lipid kinase
MKPRLLIVVNPASSRGDTAGAEARIGAAFRSRGLEFEIVHTERAGHARELVTDHGAGFDGVVAVGGDGTLHEVVQGLDLRRHRLGLIPRGSGNDFAWMNGWPADLDACAARIAADGERRIDLGIWDGGRFHTSVGVGFEAQVNYESHNIRWLRGTAIYLAALVRTLSDLRAYAARIEWPGGSWEGDMLLASVGNGRRVGGSFLMTPAARNDDGLLDICFAPRMPLAKLLAILPGTFRGRHVDRPPVQLQRGDRIRITGRDTGFPVHVDGEMVGLDVRALDLRVEPLGLRCY